MPRTRRQFHGTRSMYVAGCRCAECREANRAYSEQRRRAAGAVPFAIAYPPSPHGSINRYQRYRCRCDICRTAATARHRAWERRKREAS